ncbi:protein of unknown function DUF81 [Methanoregula boonei 6A8]|jgi:hypothetical protein|uniref:Probable membrane transporter protein n=1 Tax=Methanoregula boonei (strain DSM 21154 / JCM 14090 / 6A8) TaxID=456442 RepID=A7I513_METB6|nr:sulfite exporter TauE/SafE family protein [Methanoregula boonei]ABS54824.1 protein of unknown function DUF81 [Methanoregula boonei 6A8]
MIVSLAAFLISCGIGVIAAVIGLGGGFLYVPTLTLIFGFDPRIAVGTSLAVMVFSSFAATVVYRRQGRVLYKAAAVIAIPSIAFSMLASVISSYIDTRLIIALFALALLAMSFEMLIPALHLIRKIGIGPLMALSCRDLDGTEKIIQIPYAHLVVWGAFGGFVSGVTGTSGGAYFVPALVALGVPVHWAVATSLLAVIPTVVTGASVHAFLGHVSVPFLVLYGAGAGMGACLGAYIAPRIHPDHIRKFFGVMLIFIAVLMIQQKVLTGI